MFHIFALAYFSNINFFPLTQHVYLFLHEIICFSNYPKFYSCHRTIILRTMALWGAGAEPRTWINTVKTSRKEKCKLFKYCGFKILVMYWRRQIFLKDYLHISNVWKAYQKGNFIFISTMLSFKVHICNVILRVYFKSKEKYPF